jgi:PAS domain S-box-containing protein
LKGRKLFRLNYESQIRISLVLLVIFLILLNFGSEYLLHRTQQVLKNQIYQHLTTVTATTGHLWEKERQTDLREHLSELSRQAGVNGICFFSSDGSWLTCSKNFHSAEDHHIFWGVDQEILDRLQNEDQPQSIGTFFSDFYSDDRGATYLACYSPVTDYQEENKSWIMVETEISAFASIEKMSKLNALARILGLILASFITLLFFRNLLRPYQTIIKRAEKEALVPVSEKTKKAGELDTAVGIFEQIISELKKKEKTLQELYNQTDRKAKSLASYNEYILKSMTNGMIICDEQGKIIRMNAPAQSILELSEAQVLGRHYVAVFERQNPLSFAIKTALCGQSTPLVPEIRLSKKNGESIHLALGSSAVKDEEGKMLGAVVFMTDLTEMKRLEEEIALKDKMASLGEMSSGLAHELRNSMGAVLGFVKMLQKKRDEPASQSQTVDAIFNEAMNMESMLQRFLAFAKPSQLKIEKVDLSKIVKECLSSVQISLSEKKISFSLHSEPDVTSILGDLVLLKQSFQNLFQNSIEAMPQGGRLSVSIRQDNLASGEKIVRLRFSDTGCGIPKEIQDKIFNPFFTGKEKGTGLGLSLVRKIIDLHNGKIELESQPGTGTTFVIHLPLNLESSLVKSNPEQNEEQGIIVCTSSTYEDKNSDHLLFLGPESESCGRG